MSNKTVIDISNMELISKEMDSLDDIIFRRVKSYFDMDKSKFEFNLNDLNEYNNSYATFIKRFNLSDKERVVLLLALAREIYPKVLDPFLTKNKLYDTYYTEFGGTTNSINNSFIPTAQTALFLLYGDDKVGIVNGLDMFSQNAKLFKENILKKTDAENVINRALYLSSYTLNSFLNKDDLNITYTKDFPATLQTTNLEWDDLVFQKHTLEHIEELDLWLSHGDELLNNWGMGKSIRSGYKALFYGPPGTGKSITATLLGKKLNKPVYRIDLSQVVSKYIGETEKNLEIVFNQANNEDWILFFDEADSLFGKRTKVGSSNDKYANQETSYLLQKFDEHKGMVILASNLKDNFDEAFLRRFQSVIYFPLPNKDERISLWEKGFSHKADLSGVDLEDISYEYELSGATIMNVVRYASLMAIKNGTTKIDEKDIINGIRREKLKEGKLI